MGCGRCLPLEKTSRNALQPKRKEWMLSVDNLFVFRQRGRSILVIESKLLNSALDSFTYEFVPGFLGLFLLPKQRSTGGGGLEAHIFFIFQGVSS